MHVQRLIWPLLSVNAWNTTIQEAPEESLVRAKRKEKTLCISSTIQHTIQHERNFTNDKFT